MAADRRKLVVLVVEDDADHRTITQEIAEGLDLVVVVAPDGLEAQERLVLGPAPDVIVLDLLLPRMNGWELLDWVSKRGLLSVVPVIVLSGSPECDEVPRRFPTTFECLRKPVPVDMLRAALERACREARPDRGSSLAAP